MSSQNSHTARGVTKLLIDLTYCYVAEQFALSDGRVFQLCQIHIPFLINLYPQLIGILLTTNKKFGALEHGWLVFQAVRNMNAEERLAGLMMAE